MKNLLFLLALLVSFVSHTQIKMKQKRDIQKVISKSNTDVKSVKINVLDKGRIFSTEEYKINNVEPPQDKEFILKYAEMPEKLTTTEIPSDLKNKAVFGQDQLLNNYLKIPEIMFSKAKNSDEIISYQIYLVSKSALKYNHDKELFLGEVNFVLIDVANEASTKELAQPVLIEIDQGDVDEIAPKSFSLSKLNLPPSKIKLSEENGLDSLQIRILTASNLSGYPVSLQVEPTLKISTLTRNVNAFGMEKIDLSVSTVGSSSADSVQVSFNASSGKITPKQLTLKSNDIKNIQLQSGDRIGKVQISAIGRGSNAVAYKSNLIFINYVFPWMFLGLAMAGGLVGSVIRFRKKTKFVKLLLGMVDGLVACVLFFFLKIPIPQLGELDYIGVVIFGIGVLGGIATVTSLFPYLKSLIVDKKEA